MKELNSVEYKCLEQTMLLLLLASVMLEDKSNRHYVENIMYYIYDNTE